MRWRSRSPTPYGPASSSTATCSRWRTSATGPTRPSRPTPPRSRSASHTTPRRGSASGRRGALLPPALARLPTRRRGGAAHRAGGAACRVRTPAHDRRAGRRRGRHRTRRARRPHAIDRARSRQPRQAALPTRGGASRRAAPRPPAGRRRPRERYLAGRPDARLHGYPCHRHGARARRLRRPGRRRARRPSGHPPLRVRPGRAGARLSQGRADLERGPGELPSQVDRRQPSLLAAVWTLVSAKHLAEAGAASVTYFETTGWRGVMETDEGTGLPDRFCSRPGTVFPVYHVLADLCELAGAEVLEAKSSEPLAVEALAVRQGDRLVVLAANLSPGPRRCRITALQVHSVAVRRLDEESFAAACSDAASLRSGGRELGVVGGELELELEPFSVLHLDATP